MKNSELINKQIHEIYNCKTSFGLNVNVVKMKDRSIKEANISFNFGSKVIHFYTGDEYHNIPLGTAHYMEHLLFNAGGGKDYSNFFEALGAYSNAGTGKCQTQYFFETSDNFYESLKLLLKMVFKPAFNKSKIKKEFPIISEEIKMIHDDVSERMYEDFLSCMYFNNPIKFEIGGNISEISRIDENILTLVHKCFYNPINANLTIIGDFDCEDVFDEVEKIYKSLKINDYFISDFRVNPFEEPSRVVEEYLVKEENVTIPRVLMGIKLNIPNIDDKENLKLETSIQLLTMYLFSKGSNFIDGFEKMKVINNSYDFGTYLMNEYQYISFRCYLDDYERFIKEFKKLLNLIPTISLDSTKFEVIKRKLIGERIISLDDCENLIDISDYFNFHKYSNDEYIECIKNLKIEDLEKCLKYFIIDKNLTSVVYVPNDFYSKKSE